MGKHLRKPFQVLRPCRLSLACRKKENIQDLYILDDITSPKDRLVV